MAQRNARAAASTAKRNFDVSNVKVFANSNVGFTLTIKGEVDVIIYNCTLVSGKNGDFVSFPSRKGNDDKYYNLAYTKLSDEETQAIIDLIDATISG